MSNGISSIMFNALVIKRMTNDAPPKRDAQSIAVVNSSRVRVHWDQAAGHSLYWERVKSSKGYNHHLTPQRILRRCNAETFVGAQVLLDSMVVSIF